MLKSVLCRIDLIGVPVAMNFYGKEKAKTRFGGICSLMFIFFVCWTINRGIQDLLSTSNPHIISYESYTQDPAEMLISSENFPMAFQVRTPASLFYTPFINDKIYKLKVIHTTLDRIAYENGTVEERWTEIDVLTEKCTLQHFGPIASSVVDLDLNYTYCIAKEQPNMKEIFLQGAFISPLYKYLTVRIIQCQNETEEGGECAPPETVQAYLSGSWFSAIYANMVVNPRNYSDPNFMFRDQYYTTINFNNYKETEIELGFVELATDRGLLFETFNLESYMKVNKITEFLQFSPNPDKIVISCIFQLSKLQNFYSRSYKKIPEVLAEIGSLSNTILAVLWLLTSHFFKLKFRESLMNELFYIKSSTSPKNEDNKENDNNLANRKSSVFLSSEDNEKKEHRISSKKDNDYTIKIERQEDSQPERRAIKRFQPRNTRSSLRLPYRLKFHFEGGENKQERDQDLSSIFALTPINGGVNFPKSPKEMLSPMTFEKDSCLKLSWHEADKEHAKINRTVDSLPLSDKEIPREGGTSPQLKFGSHIEKSSPLDLKFFQEEEPEYPNESFENPVSYGHKDDKKNVLDESTEKKKPISFEQELEMIGKDKPESEMLTSNSSEATKALINRQHKKIDLKFYEYLLSFFYKPPGLKEKFEILEEGAKSIGTRLDVTNILRKLREVDKLLLLLLDEDQLRLFKNLPKPEVLSQDVKKMLSSKTSFSAISLKRTNTVGAGPQDQVLESYNKVKHKAKKTKIDVRLLQIFNEDNNN